MSEPLRGLNGREAQALRAEIERLRAENEQLKLRPTDDELREAVRRALEEK